MGNSVFWSRGFWNRAGSRIVVLAACALGVQALGCRSDRLPESVLRDLEPVQQPREANRQQPGVSPGKPIVGVLGGSPEPIVRPLSEWSLQETAADALGRMGDAAVPLMIENLQYRDPEPERQAEVRRQAAEVLARIGPDAEPAVPALIEALQDPSPSVRKAAAHALGQIGPAAEAAVPALLRTMLDSTTPQAPGGAPPLPPGPSPP